jgi:hypothetical protein
MKQGGGDTSFTGEMKNLMDERWLPRGRHKRRYLEAQAGVYR